MPVAALLACFVIGIADGDTLTARCEAAGPGRTANLVVRLAGIDAPEKRQPLGHRSQQHLAALCFQKRAEMHALDTDRYGRTVGAQRLGLWADPAPIAPWDWRHSPTAQCHGAPPWPKSCLSA
jgi:endonuclease YncB( thermonuclease family)